MSLISFITPKLVKYCRKKDKETYLWICKKFNFKTHYEQVTSSKRFRFLMSYGLWIIYEQFIKNFFLYFTMFYFDLISLRPYKP